MSLSWFNVFGPAFEPHLDEFPHLTAQQCRDLIDSVNRQLKDAIDSGLANIADSYAEDILKLKRSICMKEQAKDSK